MSKKRKIINTIKVFFILLILAVGFYPTISDAWNRYVASKMITSYTQTIYEQDTSILDKMKKDALQYNQDLFNNKENITDFTEELNSLSTQTTIKNFDSKYESLLNISNNGIIGYINIPKIDVELPVYHYTSDDVLAQGVGHLYGTSLPIGGKNTHAILSGHRGLPSAKLFTDLDKLEINDIFIINVLNEKLKYKIIDISTVLPTEVDSLSIQPNKDLLTLVTCTPYGVNTHRLLVTGTRVEEEPKKENKSIIDTVKSTFHIPWVTFGIVIFVLITAFCSLIYIWTRKNKPEKLEVNNDTKQN